MPPEESDTAQKPIITEPVVHDKAKQGCSWTIKHNKAVLQQRKAALLHTHLLYHTWQKLSITLPSKGRQAIRADAKAIRPSQFTGLILNPPMSQGFDSKLPLM